MRWEIARQDGRLFAVAGLWRRWREADGTISTAFTQLTINADGHPLMGRFHRPGDEKRSLVILPEADWDAWLSCPGPDQARGLLRPFAPGPFGAWPAPLAARTRQGDPETPQLF